MDNLDRLIGYIARLPGIGRKSASRIAYWVLEADRGFIKNFSDDLARIRDVVKRCRICGNYTEREVCQVCESPIRDHSQLCVVEHPKDLATIEATGEFRGIYHVLHGVLSPLDGIGPEELSLGKMRSRIRDEGVQEVIVATNPTLEGDSTALYIVRMLEDDVVKVSRIATGIPVGGDMEYVDKMSIARALRARQNLGEE